MTNQIQAAVAYHRRFPSHDPAPEKMTPALYVAGERRCQRTWEIAKMNGFVPDPEAFNLIDALLHRGIHAPYYLCRGSYTLRLPGEWQCPACGLRTAAEHTQFWHTRSGMIHFPHGVPR